MTKPLVTFADPEKKLIDYFVAQFTPRADAFKPATVTTDFPTTALTTATHLQVELEAGGADDYPITERAQVRVTAYAGPAKRTNVKALASLALGLAGKYAGDSQVAGSKVIVGRSGVSTDPTTKNVMVWFLVRLDMKSITTT